MRDFESEIRDLSEKTKQNRREFLRVDLQTCFIALDRAGLELSLANILEARKELAIVRRGIQVIERFLAEDPEQMIEIAAKLKNLRASAESLGLDLEKFPE